MKKPLLLFVLAILLQMSGNAQERGFGLGIILGEPTVRWEKWTRRAKCF